jgi:hypothetical protein
MRRMVLVMVLAAAPVAGVNAQDAADGAAIEAVIRDQFADFRAGDVAGAYANASPTIRQMFQSPENFGRMVQGGYPVIWGAVDVVFLGLRDEGGRTVQRLKVTDAAGRTELWDYEMIEVDGAWRINGVWPVKEQGVGA